MTHSATPIDCETAVRRLWDYLDGRLPALDRRELELHLAVCARCPPHFAFARAMQRALAASPSASVLSDEEARLRERVRRALRQVAAEAEGSDPT